MSQSLLKKRALVIPAIILAGGLSLLVARADEPTTTASTQPATQPTTQGADADDKKEETVKVEKGSIDLRIDLDGVFAPIDPFEVRLRPKAYQGEFTIVSVVQQGQKVQKGDVLLEVETKLARRQLTMAENELANAKAAMEKAEADSALGERTDELALRQSKDSLRRAEEMQKWWDDNDSKAMLTMVDINDKMANFQVENSDDELEQLKKMYKSEDLTSDTADIVMKRALRISDIVKTMRTYYGFESKKIREYYITYMRENIALSVDQSKQALAMTEASLKQQKVTRQTGLENARIALETTTDKLEDLRKDQETFKVISGADGVVLYGSFRNKTWQPMQPEQFRVGEKVAAQQVLMTVWEPSKMKVLTDLPESKLAWVAADTKAKVVPNALTGVTYYGKIESIDVTAAPKGAEQGFETSITIEGADPRIAPGFKAMVIVPGGKAEDVLVLPASAVSKGRVWVKVGDKSEPRDIVAGRSDGTNVEIKSGLNEGDEVLKQAKK